MTNLLLFSLKELIQQIFFLIIPVSAGWWAIDQPVNIKLIVLSLSVLAIFWICIDYIQKNRPTGIGAPAAPAIIRKEK